MALSKTLVIVAVIGLAAIFIHSAEGKQSKYSAKPNTVGEDTSKIDGSTQFLNIVHANESALFSQRFGKPPRKSTRFHYPELPEVYWTKHKRPVVPLFDASLYED